jgi:2,4-dienoyl-CoA reductase-like NADH-dependent reductase (Old Yellow Enzyme family)/thioredoxin reductase
MSFESLLRPFELAGLELRNRIVSTSHAPAFADGGLPGERYQAYHEHKAAGGVGLTMFGGSSIITPEISPIYRQIDVSTDAVIPSLRQFATRIHRHGTKLMCQISHMGRRTAWDDGDWIAPIGPSPVRDPAHGAVPRAMDDDDIERVVLAYGAAARRCAEGGLDGVEILVSSHLPGQFLSPEANQRDDRWGGSLDGRMRFLVEVLRSIRVDTPAGFVVSMRIAVDESSEGGAGWDDCVAVSQRLWGDGLYDLLDLSGIAASTTPGMAELIGSMARPIAPYLTRVAEFRSLVGAPVLHASRIADVATAAHALDAGAVDLVGMTRALIADPYLVRKLERGAVERIRPCVGAAYCIDRIYTGREAYCAHNPATGREEHLPQVITVSPGRRRTVVVVGGGPAGLEAARVAAARGHRVVLFEAADRLGGQVVVAARAGWRRDLIGIVDWLADEVTVLGVDVRLGVVAEVDDVLAEHPDVVVVATGGWARPPSVSGGQFAVSSADVLRATSGTTRSASSAVVYDEEGRHAALSVAQVLAEAGVAITYVTPDRTVGHGLGAVSANTYLAALARHSARLVTDHRLESITATGPRRRVTLRHEFAREALIEIDADVVVAELGTVPNDDLFHALAPRSANGGRTDPTALRDWTAQLAFDRLDGDRGDHDAATSPHRGAPFVVFRVGDVVASRDIHAAMLDSLRVMKDC